MMKIPSAVRHAYDSQAEGNAELQRRVRTLIDDFRDPRWHYEDRIKEVESFALKIESGRVHDPYFLEDFLGCTIVVRNALEVPKVEQAIHERFKLMERRPPHDDSTWYSPDRFPFDYLRLYVRLRESAILPVTPLHNITFELQIKTFLQHAWSVATHDLIYKTDDVQWSKERIAYQIKAMLEHAEVSIEQAESLSSSIIVNRDDRTSRDLQGVIGLIRDFWPVERLPTNFKQLGKNIQEVLDRLRLSCERLKEILGLEETAGRGAQSLNLTPYGVVVQAILTHERDRFDSYVTNPRTRRAIMVPGDLEPEPDPPLPNSPKIVVS
jgi:ppGpp synthetase/RelA/SpoT-type nucleotidyltranferase